MKVKKKIKRRPSVEGDPTETVPVALRRSEVEIAEKYAILYRGGNISWAIADGISLLVEKMLSTNELSEDELKTKKIDFETASSFISRCVEHQDIINCIVAWIDGKPKPQIRVTEAGKSMLSSLMAAIRREPEYPKIADDIIYTLDVFANKYVHVKKLHANSYIIARKLLDRGVSPDYDEAMIRTYLNEMINIEYDLLVGWILSPNLLVKLLICFQGDLFKKEFARPSWYKNYEHIFAAMNTPLS